MKKCINFLLIFAILCSFSGCISDKNDMVVEAVDLLQRHWKETYDEMQIETDGYFEIKNTRVVDIKDNDVDEFQNVDYIIEFELYTDMYGSAPYYQDVNAYDTVVVYKDDGSMKVSSGNLFRLYSGKTYVFDYSNIIESIKDYGGEYNCVKRLK